MGQIGGMSHEQRIVTGLALIVAARDDLMAAFGGYLNASRALEDWLAAGAPTDTDSAREISGDVQGALVALTSRSVISQRVAGGAARAAGITSDETAN